jgi:pimeloyl-ACP methyl ester carboxylesterase
MLTLLLGWITFCAAQDPLAYRPGLVKRPDGAAIAYYVREGRGPNLVLIPGSWGDRHVFDRLVMALPRDLRVIVVELRGHGGSWPPAAAPAMAMLAGDVLAVVDALGLRRYYAGGHSIGGMLTIEIAGRRPEQVAGVIAMEGWTHHEVSAQAFGGDTHSTLTREQQQIDEANRQRVLGRLSSQERAAFGSVWRNWNGLPVLETTQVPILQIWGDRGRTRPSRERMRIPQRPNIELIWMPGSSHSLLIQCPEDVARVTADFLERTEARHMFEAPELRLSSEGADFSRLPRLQTSLVTIYRGEQGSAGFNMHPYLAAYGGRLWTIWSSNRIRDLQAGQHVRYAVSEDGIRWSRPGVVAPPEEKDNFRFFARGLWVRNGELIALAARDEAVRPLFGPGLELRGYRWNEPAGAWDAPVVIARDTINNFAPTRLPSGEWMMTRRDHRMRVGMLAGGVTSVSGWTPIELPKAEDGAALDEPIWWTLPGGSLAAAFRDGSKSRRLYRSFSKDGGKSWSVPVQTDFPDASAKFNVLRLRSGLYVMASNPNPSGKRIPLCLSVSRDGRVFHRMAVLRDAPTMYRYGGKDPGYAGYHYPQLLEHGEWLYVIHAENMEDIQLLRLSLAGVERLAKAEVAARRPVQ